MRLYVADYAPNPRRVRWFMAEKGISDIDVVTVDIMALEHRRHAVVARSGAAGLPVLELNDGSVIAESVAIGRYLESLYPEPNLFGNSAREVAEIEMWTRRLEQQLATPLMLGTRMSLPALSVLEEPNPVVAAHMMNCGASWCAHLDKHLAERDFICAGRVTVADIVAICAIDFARIVRFRPDKGLENLARWIKAMRERAKALGV